MNGLMALAYLRQQRAHFQNRGPALGTLLNMSEHGGIQTLFLVAMDTFGNCQRPVSSLCVSQQMHKITNL